MLLYARRNRTSSEQLADLEMKGLGLVLNIDRDAYQAILGLTRAFVARSATERETWLAFYDDNIQQTHDRLTIYLSLPGLTGPLQRTGQDALLARGRLAVRGTGIRSMLSRGDAGDAEKVERAQMDTLQAQLDAFRVYLGRLEAAHDDKADSLKAVVLDGGSSAELLGYSLIVLLIG